MSGHTKGPWLREGRVIFTLSDRNTNHFWARVDFNSCTCPPAESLANAHLISAAPDMLSALESLIDASRMVVIESRDHHDDDNDAVFDFAAALTQACAAIKKARGEK